MSEYISQFFIDPKVLPETGYGFIQVLFLGAAYGFVLFNASNLISDGSELLLLVPSIAGIVGSVVLPVLGAVPDGAIVLFSGMGPDAQEQLSVGVGALAGSTIMLLTVPWALSVYAGRVDLYGIDKANYVKPKDADDKKWKKLTKPLSLFESGVVVSSEIALNSKIMVLTSLIYLFIQIPSLSYTGYKGEDGHINRLKVSSSIRPYALATFVVCVICFIGYMLWNVFAASASAELKVVEKTIQALKEGNLSLLGAFAEEIEAIKRANSSSHTNSYNSIPETSEENEQLTSKMREILRPFYKKYDNNGDGRMDLTEFRLFFTDLNEDISNDDLSREFQKADLDKSNFIEYEEFVTAALNCLTKKYQQQTEDELQKHLSPKREEINKHEETNDDGDEEEDEEIPSDLLGLTPSEQQSRIKWRAFQMMFLGTLAVLVFSDPMVDVLSEIGNRTGVPSFYISFILAPLASNASELIASYNYALKKTSKTITISLSALLGAACMNNTFCLGIFVALIYFQKNLVWEFSAETIAIVVVQLIMGVIAAKKTQRLFEAVIVVSLYPLSLLLVFILENGFGLD